MARDVGDLIGAAVSRAARETQFVASSRRGRGLMAGGGLMSLAPFAIKGASRLMNSNNGSSPVGKAKDKLSRNGGGSEGEAGVGKGRRMPIQQAMDVPVPVRTAYNEWTQFEDWPQFMHRLENVSQEDDTHLVFKTKIWGKSKEFKAEIVEQRPDERIRWEVTEGMTHSGVVTFHEIAPRLTRIELNLDVQPGSLIEKAARGMRHIKRAVRADMHRFKAHVMMAEEESGAWRGRVDEGRVKRTPSRSRSRSRSRARAASSSSSSSSRRRSSSSRSSNGRSRSASRS